jgi:nickel-type superoxide dismutase maturation protease
MLLLLLICSLVIITLWLLWKYKWEAIRISGNSMYPTLENGDIVLIDKRPRQPYHIGDICLLTPPDEENRLVVKRITKESFGAYFWVLGDNRNDSKDSRAYGWVKKQLIEGRVIKTWKTKK